MNSIYDVLEKRFGEKAAISIMLANTVIMLVGAYLSFRASFGMGTISMFTSVVLSFIIGIAYICTLGFIDLAAVIDHALFATTAGAIFGAIVAASVGACFVFAFPRIINEWAKSKISIK